MFVVLHYIHYSWASTTSCRDCVMLMKYLPRQYCLSCWRVYSWNIKLHTIYVYILTYTSHFHIAVSAYSERIFECLCLFAYLLLADNWDRFSHNSTYCRTRDNSAIASCRRCPSVTRLTQSRHRHRQNRPSASASASAKPTKPQAWCQLCGESTLCHHKGGRHSDNVANDSQHPAPRKWSRVERISSGSTQCTYIFVDPLNKYITDVTLFAWEIMIWDREYA